MKTQKIVLALALAAVTPAVLAAQENGNAYNKSTNEVIAPTTQQTSIASFGPEGKLLSLADNTLAKIRQNHKERKQRKEQQKQEPDTVQTKQNDTTHTSAYYPYGGPEGHMLVRADLHKNQSSRPQRDTTNKKTPSTTNRTTNTYNPYVGPEGHRMAIGNAVRDAKQDTTPVPTHVKDIDTVSTNHQVTLDEKKADKSAKRTNNTFQQNRKTFGQIIREEISNEAPYEK